MSGLQSLVCGRGGDDVPNNNLEHVERALVKQLP